MQRTKIIEKKIQRTNFIPKEVRSSKTQEYLVDHLHVPANVYDYRIGRLLYVNDKFANLIGLPSEECLTKSVEDFDKWIHPDDFYIIRVNIRERIKLLCEQVVTSQDHKVAYSFNYRLKEKSGIYRPVLNQSTVIEWDENNFPAVVISILTDLSQIRNEHKVIFSLKHYVAKQDYWKQLISEEFLHSPKTLTPREKEIMNLMLADKSATEISEMLGMNGYTVRSHWRNILQKTGCQTQKCLKDLSRKEGWI